MHKFCLWENSVTLDKRLENCKVRFSVFSSFEKEAEQKKSLKEYYLMAYHPKRIEKLITAKIAIVVFYFYSKMWKESWVRYKSVPSWFGK